MQQTTFQNRQKIDKSIICNDNIKYGGNDYQLLSSIRHIGANPYGGHYTQINYGFTDPIICDDLGGRNPKVKAASSGDEERYRAKSYIYVFRKGGPYETPAKVTQAQISYFEQLNL